jgi:class I fructose-bisphosphate aldolase
MEEFRQLSKEAKDKGLAVVLWAYARGKEISKQGETAINIISYAAHMSALLGANIIKVKLPTDFIEDDPTKVAFEKKLIEIGSLKDRVAHIKKVAFAGKRIVVFSGGDTKDDNALMDEIKAIHHGGGNGSIIGRNCFQRKREDSLKLLNQMIDIYKSK